MTEGWDDMTEDTATTVDATDPAEDPGPPAPGTVNGDVPDDDEGDDTASPKNDPVE